MGRKTFSPEQIIFKLREVEILTVKGNALPRPRKFTPELSVGAGNPRGNGCILSATSGPTL